MKIVIYVAGPYRANSTCMPGHQDMWRVQCNIMRAMEVSLQLWQRGYVPICPHAMNMFYTGAAPDALWLDGDLELIRRSDAVLLVDGWGSSTGTLAEILYAQQIQKPVFHTLDDVDAQYRENQSQNPSGRQADR